jgi:hypothetical protein
LVQLVRDLLRTPPLTQQVHHHSPQFGIDHHASGTRPCDAFGRGPVRTAGQTTAVIDVAPKLPADRRRERPNSRAISRTVRFSRRRSAITIRSSNDKYRGCRFGGVRMRTGG